MQKYASMYMLTEDQRLDAKERAKSLILRSAGDEPQPEQFRRAAPLRPDREQYADTYISRYPAWLTKAVGAVMLVVFVAAAMPSLFRLYTAGRDYFGHGISDPLQGAVVGVSTFLLAEFLIVLSTISARVYFQGAARLLFVVPIGMGLAVALVGNWTITQPSDLFGWLETVVPPVSVVFIALVLEKLILDGVHSRHANEKAYQQAVAEWNQAVNEQKASEELAYRAAILRWQTMTREPEESDHWRQVYATALREAIKAANAQGRGKTERVELMQSFNGRDWSILVRREMEADRWYERIDEEPAIEDAPTAHNLSQEASTSANFTLPALSPEEEDTQPAQPVTAS